LPIRDVIEIWSMAQHRFDETVRVLIAMLAVTFGLAASVFVGADLTASAQPDAATQAAPTQPEVDAEAWLIANLDTGEILAARNASERRAPASTIKTLLALVALDQLPLNSTIVANKASVDVECSCAGVKPGRPYTALQLLAGALLVSGNDAANTLADMLGGPQAAVAKMNLKAKQVGALNTYAATPSGLDGPGITGLTTPHDLAVIFRAALAKPVFVRIMQAPSAMFPDDNGFRTLTNQDKLLGSYPGILGGKTGYTDIAGKTFVGAAQRDGRRLVVVFMGGGPEDYWDQAANMLNWGFSQPH
jgi:D-alanyl-D-alanine carboxypeptidase (penicillin-binding protein 5/6)